MRFSSFSSSNNEAEERLRKELKEAENEQERLRREIDRLEVEKQNILKQLGEMNSGQSEEDLLALVYQQRRGGR